MSNTDPIRNTEDVLDTRDILARIDYLDNLAALVEQAAIDGVLDGDIQEAADELEEAQAEHTALTDLWEAEGDDEWQWGATLIRADYFEDYTRDFAEEIGAIVRDAAWPANHIDWEAAADELAMDYREVEFDGQTYLVR